MSNNNLGTYDPFQALSSRLSRIIPREQKQKPSVWIVKFTFDPRDLEKNFSWKNHEYWIAIVDDEAREITVKKPAQVGATETFARYCLWFVANNRNVTAIFTQPTATMVETFSRTRFAPVLEASHRSYNFLDDIDTVKVKKISGSFMMFFGTKNEKMAISNPADMVVYDELNFSDMDVVSQFYSRLGHSEYKLVRRFSTPTYKGMGVDEYYQLGSQHNLLYKCPACNVWNLLTYKEVLVTYKFPFDLKKNYWECSKCGRKVDKLNDKWEWVPRHRKREAHSYWLRKSQVPYHIQTKGELTPALILDECNNYRTKQHAFWYGLGEEASGGEETFPRTVMSAAFNNEKQYSPFACSIGIDTGKPIYFVVGMQEGQRKIVLHKEWATVENALYVAKRLIDLYKPWHVNIDAPLHKFIIDVRNIFPDTKTVWFRNTTKLVDEIQDPDNPRIVCNRDALIQMLSDEYKNREIVVVGKPDQDFIDHHHNMKNIDGKFKGNGPDHYLFATLCSFLPFWNKKRSNLVYTGISKIIIP